MLGILFQIGVGTGDWNTIINTLGNLGVFVFVLPFLLALAVFYGVLHYVFGDKMPKSAIGMISLVMAFFVMLYASWNPAILSFLTNLTGATLIIGSGVLIIAILLGIIGFKVDMLTDKEYAGRGRWVFILALLVIGILVFFGAGGGVLGLVMPNFANNGTFLTAVFVIIVLALAVWWLASEEESKG